MNYLTLEERERHAYISGDTATADLCALAIAGEDFDDSLPDDFLAKYQEGHAKGYALARKQFLEGRLS